MKLNKKYLAPLCSLFVTGGLLITIAVLTLGSSFGWFSNNDKVSASGISVSSVSPYKTEQKLYVQNDAKNGLVELSTAADAKSFFSGMVPNDTKTVYVAITNNEETALNVELLLSAPNESDEVCVTNNGLKYYFGSQIKISTIQLSDATGAITDATDLRTTSLKESKIGEAYLLTMPKSFYDVESGLQGVGVSAEYNFTTASQKKISEAVEVTAGATVYVAVTFEFVENGQVQNPYINFGAATNEDGTTNGTLSRQLLCWYN